MDALSTAFDWETFSESGSSDQEEIDFLFGGQAQRILSSLEESIGKIDNFLSFERLFIHGDAVCSVTNPSGQMGKVINVDMLADLESVHGRVVKNVNSKKLLRIRSISEGDFVVQGLWLGRVDNTVDKVTILFDDGAKCEILALEREKLLPVGPNVLEDSQYPYYPGQRVRVKLSPASESSRWFCGTLKEDQYEGTVCDVEAGLVYVNWLASVLTGSNLRPAPSRLQDAKNVTLLSCFAYANWQLGDWCKLPNIDRKALAEHIFLNGSTADIRKENKMIERGFERSVILNTGEIYVIVKTKTKLDVLWQNGTLSLGLDSQDLLPVSDVNAHEFWPEQVVLEKCASDDPLKSGSQRWGIVQSVDAKERTVKVQWKTTPLTEPEYLAGEKMEETVSAYELFQHPDYSFCYGDIVFKSAQEQLGHQADKDHGKPATGLNAEDALTEKNRIQNELPENFDLSCIGNVIGFRDGAVEVRWATGLTTKVAPYEIFRFDKYEDSTSSPAPYDLNVEELTQEVTEHENQSSYQKGKGLLSNDDEKVCGKYSLELGAFSFPQAAVGLFSRIKSSMFRSLGVTPFSRTASSVHISENAEESVCLNGKEVSETCDPCSELHTMIEFQPVGKRSADQGVVEYLERKDLPPFSSTGSSDQFKQFDVMSDCSDHHFIDFGKGSALSQVKKGWLKKVQQEWFILENNLPETIYARVFEERMDLLRAAIVGAPGTPYHDGLFFFDIFFPPDYPYEPPMVHYISGGLRVNPNLYESGKVCLSLLNTWNGTGNEVWNPEKSTILQVLLSLQALVLNEKPYFNEAGYDKHMGRVEGEKNSGSYNENAFLLTCKSMLYLLQKPPKHFEALVDEHFRLRSQYILLACKAYLEGAPIGCAFGCGKGEHERKNCTSMGFKIMLSKLFSKLVEAFSGKGVDCSQFVEHRDVIWVQQ